MRPPENRAKPAKLIVRPGEVKFIFKGDKPVTLPLARMLWFQDVDCLWINFADRHPQMTKEEALEAYHYDTENLKTTSHGNGVVEEFNGSNGQRIHMEFRDASTYLPVLGLGCQAFTDTVYKSEGGRTIPYSLWNNFGGKTQDQVIRF